jgi:hypothetical protein
MARGCCPVTCRLCRDGSERVIAVAVVLDASDLCLLDREDVVDLVADGPVGDLAEVGAVDAEDDPGTGGAERRTGSTRPTGGEETWRR